MKTIIENLVAKHEGKKEQELPERTTIRFEIGDTRLSCIATDEGLEIYKVTDLGIKEQRIIIMSISSNKVCIK